MVPISRDLRFIDHIRSSFQNMNDRALTDDVDGNQHLAQRGGNFNLSSEYDNDNGKALKKRMSSPDTLTEGSLPGMLQTTGSSSCSLQSESGIFIGPKSSSDSSSVVHIQQSGRQLFGRWIFTKVLPFCVATWICTNRIWAVILAAVAIPLLALVQGGFHILRYRIGYSQTQPIPRITSHGVVKVVPRGLQYQPTKDLRRPLRLLLIGDSLACGVGQCHSPTPVMPESIAKSLSKATEGRTVIWTCQGAPGASASWIARELERVHEPCRLLEKDERNELIDKHESTWMACEDGKLEAGTFSDTEYDDSSDDSSSRGSIDSTMGISKEMQKHCDTHHMTISWQERLNQEGIDFDQNNPEPYDIAVVITGGNDLKSIFFPFMLTGEDLALRRQARLRGGGFTVEFSRVLQALRTRMRKRVDTFKGKLETAADTVIDTVDNAMDRLGIQHQQHNYPFHGFGSGPNDFDSNESTMRYEIKGDGKLERRLDLVDEVCGKHDKKTDDTCFPIVVLPGMPASSVPMFNSGPLRWMSIPIVEVMDSHKHDLAKQQDGEAMFVPAPSTDQVLDYYQHKGEFWQEHLNETTLLNLHDIEDDHAHLIRSDMRSFYRESMITIEDDIPDDTVRTRTDFHRGMFSPDQIHPNDLGYDLWGRIIAKYIVEQWKINAHNR